MGALELLCTERERSREVREQREKVTRMETFIFCHNELRESEHRKRGIKQILVCAELLQSSYRVNSLFSLLNGTFGV